MSEIDFTDQIKAKLLEQEGFEEELTQEAWAAEENSGKKLNKPFRTSGGPKKFSVYVKNEKGNVVKVNFGDPNMSIKRDDPTRRKSFRARHGCDNPGPKTKAKYWSCKMWSKKSVTKMTKGEEQSFEELEDEMAEFLDESDAKGKGLWHNIREKKKREGKNYKPAKPGDKDYPDSKSLKKAQGPKKKKSKAEDEKEDKKGKESKLTEQQKKLPDAIKKSILNKKDKTKAEDDNKESKLTDQQKKLPDAIKKSILEKKKKSKAEDEEFKPHKMYDKNGKAYDAKSKEDHLRMKKMGYTHEKPSESGYKGKKKYKK